MKRKYKTILFDFDGTIADTKECIISSFQKSLASFDLTPIDEKELVSLIGKSLTEQVKILIPSDSSDIFYDTFVAKYRQVYAEESKTKLAVFKGVKKVLNSMWKKKIVMTIVSSKKESVLQNDCKILNIENYFDLLVGPDSVTHHKPHPESVHVSMKKLGITNKASLLVIGDATFDIDMGNAASVDTCAVTWGVHSRNLLLSSKPTYIIDNVADLSKFI